MNDPEYHASGNPGKALWLMPAISIPALLTLTALTGWLNALFRSTSTLSLVLLAVSLFAVGNLLYKTCLAARCRSLLTATALGLLCGGFAVYSDWTWYEVFRLPKTPPTPANVVSRYFFLFSHPGDLWENARTLNRHGTTVYTRTNADISTSHEDGWSLWAWWGVDAALFVVVSTLSARAAVNKRAFCEHCSKWIPQYEVIRYRIPKDKAVVAQVKNGDFSAVMALTDGAARNELPHWMLQVCVCPTCDAPPLWRVSTMTKGLGDEPNETAISPFHLLSTEEFAGFRIKYPLPA